MVTSLPWRWDAAFDEGGPLPALLVSTAVGVLARGVRPLGGARARSAGGPRAWRAPVVLIDGRSGSGKSTLATLLAREARTAGVRGVRVARLDSWYPGWHGLARGSAITEALLRGLPRPGGPGPLRLMGAGVQPAYPAWDWERDRVARSVPLDPSLPIIVEGSGALTPLGARAADLRVWVEVGPSAAVDPEGDEPGVRHTRAMARDGESYRPWWDAWAAQEDAHLRGCDPRSLADLVVMT